MADGLITTEVSFRMSPAPGDRLYNGALRQVSRLVWVCDHPHRQRNEAKACAREAADDWPGRERWLAGPCRVEQFALPRLPVLPSSA